MTPSHGTRTCYVAGCRSPQCVAVNTAYQRAWRNGTPPPVTSARDRERMVNPLDLSWRRYGACRGKPVAWWYPVGEEMLDDDTLRAKALCEACPVMQQCLAWALEHEDHGIWAGTSESERRRIRRRAGIRLDAITLDPRSVVVVALAVDPFEESA